jgi:hypothetical protein
MCVWVNGAWQSLVTLQLPQMLLLQSTWWHMDGS